VLAAKTFFNAIDQRHVWSYEQTRNLVKKVDKMVGVYFSLEGINEHESDLARQIKEHAPMPYEIKRTFKARELGPDRAVVAVKPEYGEDTGLLLLGKGGKWLVHDRGKACEACLGSGVCPKCGGKKPKGAETCWDCDGEGKSDDGTTCETCGGTGKLKAGVCSDCGEGPMQGKCSHCKGHGFKWERGG
jgi:hypothetical protein